MTQVVKQYDPNLFIHTGEADRKMYLMRKNTRWESFVYDEDTYLCSRSDPQMIFALTDNWMPSGNPIDCGIEFLMSRIKEIDSHRSSEIIERVDQAMEMRHEAKNKDLQNNVESFAYDLRTAVKNDFKDYNLSSVDKTDVRVKHDKIAKRKGL